MISPYYTMAQIGNLVFTLHFIKQVSILISPSNLDSALEEYIDLTEEKQEMKKNTSIETGVDLIMADGVGKTKLRATDLRYPQLQFH